MPHGFCPAAFVAARAQARPGRVDVVAVGTGAGDGRKKGVDVLLAALDLLRPRRLSTVVVGRLHGPRPDGVVEMPWLPDAELAALVASARVLVHAARSEGFGYPPLEAMAAGVPAVVSSAASLPEVVGDAALLVPPGDAAALAAALARALDDDALRAELVRRGEVRARAFPPATAARRALEVLLAVARPS